MTGDEEVLSVGSYRCLIADKFGVKDSTVNEPYERVSEYCE